MSGSGMTTLEEVERQLAWVRRQLLDSLEDRREMAAEEKQLVHRHREIYRRHENETIARARVVTATIQTAQRRQLLEGLSSQGCPEGQPAKPRSHCFDKKLVPALNSR